MDYSRIYNELITNAKTNLREGFTETHHIIPKCFGGDNSTENLVILTCREHFVAHLLLYKMQTEKRKRYQMLTAVVLMSNKSVYKSSRQYAKAKEEYSNYRKEHCSGVNHSMYGVRRFGELNPFYGKKHSKESKIKMSLLAKDKVLAKDLSTGLIIKVTREEYDSNPNLVGSTRGNKASEETKRKMSESTKGIPKKKYPCQYCGHYTDPGNLKKWHNENCKSKPEV